MLSGSDIFLQQDGAAGRASKSVMTWIRETGEFQVLFLAFLSPGSESVGLLCVGISGPQVLARNPKTEVELRCAIRKAAAELGPAAIKRAV